MTDWYAVEVLAIVPGDPDPEKLKRVERALENMVGPNGSIKVRVHPAKWNSVEVPRKVHLRGGDDPYIAKCGCFAKREMQTDSADKVTCKLCLKLKAKGL